MKNLRVVFMGTPEFSCPILESLIEQTNVVLVVSQPDSEVGRKKILTPSKVKELALKHNIEVFTPSKIREEYKKIIESNPDIIITCAYGQIIPKILLDYPKFKAINIHASLLPKYRGGAPIHHSIINGDKETGITIMYMDVGMDDGDIIKEFKISIDKEDNLDLLSSKLSLLGAKSIIEVLPSIINGTCKREKQNSELVTYAKIIKKEDELLHFNKTALEVYNQIRGLSSNPGAYFLLNGNVVKVYASRIGEKVNNKVNKITNIYKDGIGIGCKDKEIILTEIKPAGKNRISAKDYLNGVKKEELERGTINDGIFE